MDRRVSEGFAANRKEVPRGKRALSVPLVLEMVGCRKQVDLQILFSWNRSSNYGLPLYFAAVNPAFWHQGRHDRTAERTWNAERREHIKIQITAVSYSTFKRARGAWILSLHPFIFKYSRKGGLTSNVNLLGPQSDAHTGMCVCVCGVEWG